METKNKLTVARGERRETGGKGEDTVGNGDSCTVTGVARLRGDRTARYTVSNHCVPHLKLI